MPLTAGTRLGAYEILAPIGKGGMGEVYRARDSKLGRDVAIKVLPDEFARDEERLRRFQREARVLASLNHPNIASIHGFEESGETHYLVLELVEGETLAERIARGPLPVDEALLLFIQIADGLEDAHGKGIVHRDLKPANIKVGRDGRVKILDFGLAKAFGSDEPFTSELSQSPTLTRNTVLGAIMGTAAYMSPEQAKGRVVDCRTDIWAFGCCLYEALTGRRLFDGEDVSDTLASVLRDEPTWSVLSADTPPAVLRLLRRCLQKAPARRLAHIADAKLDLRDARLEEPMHAPSTYGGRGAQWAQIAIVAFVAALMTALTLLLLTRDGGMAAPKVSRFVVPIGPGERLGARVAISPDGLTIVYLVAGQRNSGLVRRRLDELQPVAIEGTAEAETAFFSPDGEWIGFWADGVLKRVAVSGGAPVDIGEAPRPFGLTWGLDGTILFGTISPAGSLYAISADAGKAEPVLEPDFSTKGDRTVLWPRHLPDARGVLLTLSRAPGMASKRVAVLPAGETSYRELTPGSGAVYVPTGHIVFARETAIWAAPFDLELLALTGAPAPVLTVGMDLATGTGNPGFDVSKDGVLVYRFTADAGGGLFSPVWVSRNGSEEPLEVEPAQYRHVAISPDGGHAAFQRMDDGGDIWIWNFGRNAMARLTYFEGQDGAPVWTPDGRRILHSSARDGPPSIYSIPVDGLQEPNLEYGPDPSVLIRPELQPTSISPDGRWLVIQEMDDFGRGRLLIARLGEEAAKSQTRAIDAPFGVGQGAVSPDGRFIAYSLDQATSGRPPEVYVNTFPDVSGRRWPVSAGGGHMPVWGSDGTELFYVRGDSLMGVDIDTTDGFEPGVPEPLFGGSYLLDRAYGRTYDIAPDGRFLMLKRNDEVYEDEDVDGIVVVQNWFEELKRLVPTED